MSHKRKSKQNHGGRNQDSKAVTRVGSSGASSRQLLEVDVSIDEVCYAVMLRVFSQITPTLSAFVKAKMKNIYGDERWLAIAKDCVGLRMKSFCREKETWDLYTVCEVLLDQVEAVFLPHSLDVDGLGRGDVLLEQVTQEVDTICQSRTWMFHSGSGGLSPREAKHCLVNLSRLVRRFCQDLGEEVAESIQVNLKVTFSSSLVLRYCARVVNYGRKWR